MPETTHEGNDPMGAPTTHRGPLDRAAEAQQSGCAHLVGILAAHTDSLAATIEGFTGVAATTLQPGLKRTLDFLRLYKEQMVEGRLTAEMRRLLNQLAAEPGGAIRNDGPADPQPIPDLPVQLTPCTCRQAIHALEHAGRTVPDCPWCMPTPDIRPNRKPPRTTADVALPDHTVDEEA